MSKNALTIEQMSLACKHVFELIDAGMSENLAIRSLEIYAKVYAKCRVLGEATPDHADQYDHWSKAVRKAKAEPDRPYGQYLRVEHGTPRRHCARLVLDVLQKAEVNKSMDEPSLR
jgi:hypothetical protein